MCSRQKLLSLWVWLLLMAALLPGAQYAYGKPGGGFRGRGKGDDNKNNNNKGPPSKSSGLPNKGLKWMGAAAAGILGGTGTGYGLGFLGKSKHGSGSHHKTTSHERDQRLHYEQHRNQSLWRTFVKAAAPVHVTSSFLTLGQVMLFLTAVWMRDI